jgi:DNA polymerase III epsilon subunit-like protein
MGEEVMGIHGITNEQVQNQPMFPQVAKFVEFILTDKHVVCYNSAFDIKLLWNLFKKYEQTLPKVSGISCAMEKYSEFMGEWNDKKDGLRWHKLPNLSGMPAHDAYSDCVSTVKLLEMMAGKFDPTTVTADEIDLNF